MTPDERRRLARLSPATRNAIRSAFIEWVSIATEEDYEPICNWRNAANEVGHSALLTRLLNGERPYVERPPTWYSYPDYDEMEKLGKELRP